MFNFCKQIGYCILICFSYCQHRVEEPPVEQAVPGFGVNISGAEYSYQIIPGIEGINFHYPNKQELTYYRSKGLKLIRVPFAWERMQPMLYGPLDPMEISRMRLLLREADTLGLKVLPDLHNYGRRFNGLTHHILGSGELPVAAIVDFWDKFSGEFSIDTAIWAYGLMNEPHDMLPDISWFSVAQQIITRIRQKNDRQCIAVAGNQWSSSLLWPSLSDTLRFLQDPLDKILYEAHCYFDRWGSGQYTGSYTAEGAYPAIAVDRLLPFMQWLKTYKKRGFIGEFGVPGNDKRWLDVLDSAYALLSKNLMASFYWSGGSHWQNYPLSIHPVNGADAPQMQVLLKYLP